MFVKPKSAFDKYVSAAVRKERMAQRVSQATLAYGIGVSDGFISQAVSYTHLTLPTNARV